MNIVDDEERPRLINPIRLEATVVKGFGRGGKQLGCPTANMSPSDLGTKLQQLDTGIYLGWAMVDGDGPYKAVASIGWNPFYQNKEKTVEPHLIHEFPNDFYDSNIKLILCGYLREEKNFPSLEDLIRAIKTDISKSNKYLKIEPFKDFETDEFFHRK